MQVLVLHRLLCDFGAPLVSAALLTIEVVGDGVALFLDDVVDG